jgi:hypothetical protein
MIRDQNAFAMFLVSALVRGMHPLNVRHIEYFQGANASHKRTGYRPLAHDVTAPVTMHLEDKLSIYA